MSSIFLFPNKFRIVGFILFPIAITIMVLVFGYEYYFPFLSYPEAEAKSILDFRNNNLTDELGVILTIISLLLIAFTKEKYEDEYVNWVRLKALQISVYINYIVLIVSTLLVYGTSYLNILYANLFTILIIFISVYYYNVHIKGHVTKERA